MSVTATTCSAEEEAGKAEEADKDKAREAASEVDSLAVAASQVEVASQVEEDQEDSKRNGIFKMTL